MGWDKLPVAIGQHLLFTLVSVAIGFALGLVLGILLSRRPKLSGVVLPVLSVFNTIPGIVFIGLLVLAWGAGTATVLVALGIYATFPVLKNTYAGLVSVDQQYIEADVYKRQVHHAHASHLAQGLYVFRGKSHLYYLHKI